MPPRVSRASVALGGRIPPTNGTSDATCTTCVRFPDTSQLRDTNMRRVSEPTFTAYSALEKRWSTTELRRLPSDDQKYKRGRKAPFDLIRLVFFRSRLPRCPRHRRFVAGPPMTAPRFPTRFLRAGRLRLALALRTYPLLNGD